MTSPDERPARQEVDMLKRTLSNKRNKDPKPKSEQSIQKPGKKKPSRMALPVFAFALLACGTAHADICRVTTAGTETGTGSDWAAPMDLHTALADTGCTEIWVAAGVYKPVEPDDPDSVTQSEREISFVIDRQVEIYGGFEGTETERDERDPAANPTVLTGDIDNNDTTNDDGITEHYDHVVGDNSLHVVWIDGGTTAITNTTVIDGFVITAGRASVNTFPSNAGAGLFCKGENSECSPLISNTVFIGHRAYFGGAMYNNGLFGISDPTLIDVTFSANYAVEKGGAMHNRGSTNGQSSPVLYNVTFSDNLATGDGGAMYNDGHTDGISSPTLTNVTFSGNSASWGSGMYNMADNFGNSSPSLTNVTMIGNLFSNTFSGHSYPILNNVIVWGSIGFSGHVGNFQPEVSHSIIQGGCPTYGICENVSNEYPQLGPLQNNGGLTQTMKPAAPGPASGAGDGSVCPDHDQRGVPRPQDGACDIGAVELFPIMNVEVVGQGVVHAGPTPEPFSGGIEDCDASGSGQAHCSAEYADHENQNITLSFVPVEHSQVGVVSGCGGVLQDDIYTIAELNTHCTVTIEFLDTREYTVTASGGDDGVVAPLTQTVVHDHPAVLSITPDAGYFPQISGNCPAGVLTGTDYHTGPITADCEVVVGFAPINICRVTTEGTETGNGADFNTQAMTLHSALDNAGCNEIWVAGGVYKPVEPDDPDNVTQSEREISFVIDRQVEIYGGFEGNETERDERDPAANLTILSGDIDNNDTTNDDGVTEDYYDISGANSFNIVWVDGTTTSISASTVVDGFVITGGQSIAFNDPLQNLGGGLYCDGENGRCSPLLSNITFSGNFAHGGGGAMVNLAMNGISSPILTNVTFSGNFSYGNGGAMANLAVNGISRPSLTNVTFSGNKASWGGAMANMGGEGGDSSPTLTNVTFNGNGDGAMFNYGEQGGDSSPMLTNVTFNGNSAGALVNRVVEGGYSGPTLTNVIVWDSINNELATTGALDISHSILRDGCPAGAICENISTEDPQLGPLQDNGGFTQTLLPDIEGPAIDAGDNHACPQYDQRGVYRPQGAGCDIGAVERVQLPYALTVEVSGQGAVSAGLIPEPVGGGIEDCNQSDTGQVHCTADYGDNGYQDITLNLTPDPGWQTSTAHGCDGTLDGNTFTIAALATDCTVTVEFSTTTNQIFGDRFETE